MTNRLLLLIIALGAFALALVPTSFAPQPALAQPPNDNLANAITVFTPSPSGIAATGTNNGATTETNEKTSFTVPPECPGDIGPYTTNFTVWYNWTAPSTATFVFDTFGSTFDTTLAVYTGSAFPLTLEACREGSPVGAGPSALAFAATGGTTYRIQIGGKIGGAGTGNFVLSIARGAGIYVNTSSQDDIRNVDLSLREAMLLANGGLTFATLTADEQAKVVNGAGAGASGADLIHFPFAIFDINLGSALPTLNTASGDHVSGIGATVEVDGQTSSFACFTLTSNGNAVSGLTIRRCTNGVSVTGSGNRIGGTASTLERNVIRENSIGINLTSAGALSNSILGNYIGTDAAGSAAGPGNTTGILIDGGADNNFVGGDTTSGRNVISGNTSEGVKISGTGTTNNVVRGNYLGTNAAGAGAVGNALAGVMITAGATNNIVGPQFAGSFPDERNVISGNGNTGVFIFDIGTNSNIIRGNYIGTNAAGTTALGSSTGVSISFGANNIIGPQFGGSSPGERNIISGNVGNGVDISSSSSTGNIVRGNYIGLGPDGSTVIANTQLGVIVRNGASNNTIGGSVSGDGNVISGNGLWGIAIQDSGTNGNFVRGNTVGLDAGGTLDRGNNLAGVVVFNSAANNTIGGALISERNVISGNNDDGLNLQSSATGTVIKGNYIGINAAGTAAVANAVHGVRFFSSAGNNNTVGGSAPGERNVISGNAFSGVLISGGSGHSVIGNYIGTNAAGSASIPNSSGVSIATAGVTVGGASLGEGNVISGNNNYGVTLFTETANGDSILGNRIGTDALGNSGIPNLVGVQVESGARSNTIGNTSGGGNLIAFNSSSGVVVNGFVAGTEDNSIRGNSIHSNGGLGIDLVLGGNASVGAPSISSGSATTVSGSACSGCAVDVYSDAVDEGRHHVGSTTASLGGFWSLTLSSPPPAAKLTAAATDANNTSEFSAPFNAELCDGLDNDGDNLVDEGYSNSDGDNRKDCVDFGQTAFYPQGHNHTAPIVDCSGLPEDVDGFRDSDGCPEPDNDNDFFNDADDQCDGTDEDAGSDGALGVGADQNHDGLANPGPNPPAESWPAPGTSGNDDSVQTFEDYDGILDTDGCHDSPCDDADGDSFGSLTGTGCPLFADEREATLGTNAIRACAATATANDESPDPYPLDTNDDGFTDITDLGDIAGRFGDAQTPANVRYDFNLDGFIDIVEIGMVAGRFGQPCVPPG